jgi:ABC-2 type transport system ATP-binding protein
MSLVKLKDIHRSYEKGVPVLKGIDLTVEPGEVVALVGRNGAGKTSLIRIAMGLIHAQRGTVRIFDLDPWERPVEVKTRIGYVSEEQLLPGYLTVREVLDLHRALYPSWDEGLARELSERFAMKTAAKVGTLSKGEARQVAFLCAIAHRPELLILDEPAGGLDPAMRRDFLEAAITRLNRDGTAILFSSHHMTDIERIASRVVLIHQGRKWIDTDLDTLREGYSVAALPTDVDEARLQRLPACVSLRRRPGGLYATLALPPEEAAALIREAVSGASPQCRTLPLEDLFIEMVEGTPCSKL